MKRIVIVVASLFYILFYIPNFAFAYVYADSSKSDDTGDGSSWSTAKKYLQSALALATSGDTIYVAQGTYYPDEGTDQTDNDPTSTFQMISGVNIYGGYPTGGGDRDVDNNVTILSGDLDQSGTKNTNDAYHVVTGANSATIDGFTITAGNAVTGVPNYSEHGGGMLNNMTSPTINDCQFSNNSAAGYGGAIHNIISSCTITSCTFTVDTANLGGGAVNNAYSSNTYTGCTFTGNYSGGSGGAMRNYDSGSPTVTSCIFSDNTATTHGGGVYHNSTGALTLTNCTFSDNTATSDGGAVGSPQGDNIFTRCTFSGNQGSVGGAISTNSGTPTITNCVLSGNIASSNGGGIYNTSAYPTLMNCTLYNNTATTSGNEFYDASGLGTITNSILWGSNSEITGSPTVTYSDVQQSSGTYTGTGNINNDPLFVSGSDLHLTEPSPCIDTGTSTGAPADDRDGNTRPDPPGSNPDMGAYESIWSNTAVYADSSKSDDTGDGSSWSTAKKYLQSALALATSGDTIYVAQGTYYPDEGTDQTDNDPTSTFQMISGVNIYGGYPTGGGDRDVDNNVTILSGDLDQSGTKNTNDAYHVVTGANSATIDGFTITAGNAVTGVPNYSEHGGGMLNNMTSPTINDCQFSNNSAAGYGGAIHNIISSCTITSCTFTVDTANLGGGAVNNAYSSNTYTGCTFTGNYSGGSGGAMRNYDSGSPTVTSCIFSDNTATTHGGGVYHNSTGALTLTNCTFSDNTATSDGGAVGSPQGDNIFTRCTFSGNQGSVGGAISTNSGTPTITNCVLSGNIASSNGGGIYNTSAYPTLMNCTLYNNTATTSGNEFYDASGLGTITNSILWGSNSEITGSPTVTYSDVQQSSGTYTGTGNINNDPLFVSGSDLHLTEPSPCIDTGTSTGAPADDRDGNTRPDPPGSNPDMGAYENSRSDPAIRLQTKVFLEGPYVAADDSMTTTLCPDNDDVIPTTSPYSDGRTVDPIPSDVTDWIFVKLRSTAEGAAVDSCSFFLKSNGNIVDDDGTTSYVPMDASEGDYFIVVEHRNHLTVMSASAQSLTSGSSTLYDFSTGTDKYYGADAALLETGVYGMYAGDTNGSGIVTNSDKTSIISDLNSSGYYDADANCSGVVTNSDKTPIISNLNKASDIQ